MHCRQPNVTFPVGPRVKIASLTLLLVLLSGCTAKTIKQPRASALINQVDVSDRITTSGQPTPTQLDRMEKSDYELVVNLSPLGTLSSVPGEERIVTDKGIDYVHIPVDGLASALEQFEIFSDTLDRYSGKNILVHCQVNMRASLFTFLYQVVREGIDSDVAFQEVTAIWVPDNRWVDFIDHRAHR